MVKKIMFRDFAICHENRFKNLANLFDPIVKLELGSFYGLNLSCYRVAQYSCSEKNEIFADYIYVAF